MTDTSLGEPCNGECECFDPNSVCDNDTHLCVCLDGFYDSNGGEENGTCLPCKLVPIYLSLYCFGMILTCFCLINCVRINRTSVVRSMPVKVISIDSSNFCGGLPRILLVVYIRKPDGNYRFLFKRLWDLFVVRKSLLSSL